MCLLTLQIHSAAPDKWSITDCIYWLVYCHRYCVERFLRRGRFVLKKLFSLCMRVVCSRLSCGYCLSFVLMLIARHQNFAMRYAAGSAYLHAPLSQRINDVSHTKAK